jgi:hypothetical protein
MHAWGLRDWLWTWWCILDQTCFWYWEEKGKLRVCSDDSKYIHITGNIENLIQKRMLRLCSNQFKKRQNNLTLRQIWIITLHITQPPSLLMLWTSTVVCEYRNKTCAFGFFLGTIEENDRAGEVYLCCSKQRYTICWTLFRHIMDMKDSPTA